MDFEPIALLSHIENDLGSLCGPRKAAQQFACSHLLSSIVKKFTNDDVTTAGLREKSAIDTFLRANEKCGRYSYSGAMLDAPEDSQVCSNEAMLEIERLLESWAGPRFSWKDIYSNGYFASGSSVAVKHTDEFEKRSGVRSCSRKTLFQQWQSDGWGTLADLAEVEADLSGSPVHVCNMSNTSTVSKSKDTDRTICTEPSINMYYQLGLGVTLAGLLKQHFDIDLEIQQSVNRHLARVGSVTGKVATIDLASASDTISMEICKARLPAWFYDILVYLRCDFTKLPNGKTVRLRMMSSMGNGYTFPLQTLLFAAVVRAAYKIYGIPARGASAIAPTFGVNGDDIIVDSRAFDLVVDVLTRWGFEVNVTKTFNTGSFRESCGGDYYNGHYVRGVYIKRIDNPQDVASAINRLIVWSGRWQVFLPNAIGYLKSLLSYAPLVPRWDDDTAGIKVPASYLVYAACEGRVIKSKRGMSWKLGRSYHPCVGVSRHNGLRPYYYGSLIYQRWAPLAQSREIDIDAAPYSALLVSIAGKTQAGTIGVRLKQGDNPVYRNRWVVAPCWEQHESPLRRDLTIPIVGHAAWYAAFTNSYSQ